MEIRKKLEEQEKNLHPRAACSVNSRRNRHEKKSPVRTEFQRDRDRILHSKSFRRLKHKTQVFISPEGDHYRTRLTHTLEVSQIARTIARALNLNEDLTEAIALGHDLGHTPFGHIGEEVLNDLAPGGFRHYEQSLRVVDKLEYDGKGLNLTQEVREGISKHSKGIGPILPKDKAYLPATLEAQIVRLADVVAYVNHDIDDALRAGIITGGDIPSPVTEIIGTTFAKRIDSIVVDVIKETILNKLDHITFSEAVYRALIILREFLFEKVYWCKETRKNRGRINEILVFLHSLVSREPQTFIHPYPQEDPIELRVIDFIAGMTDRYALNLFKKSCSN